MTPSFVAREPKTEDHWRSIILFGRNAASYKFALARALIDFRPQSGQLVKTEELADPFATAVSEHLKTADKQSTSANSRFLDACRKFNAEELTKEDLVAQTIRLGFNNVIDAFHIVGRAETPIRFFVDERRENGGIRITDDFSELTAGPQLSNFPHEIEARWKLVETAWMLGVSRSLVSIGYDSQTEGLFAVDREKCRKPVTSCRHALNGYQKGKCFYCFADIRVSQCGASPDVDHFFPHVLKQYGFGPLVDGVWNLVLACRDCNRGVGGKADRLPTLGLLQRLWHRNEFLIHSHHPLRETLIQQTGAAESDRRDFLNGWHSKAWATLIHKWEPEQVSTDPFF